ncbi:GFA family protein [Burkholderia thailandensis]|uniref:Glutathione-dependent formaldehyde-activating enzyme family protein n=1 Tax=Burkholderia thailandensis TaxID=57975 RepID=A0AAW9D055_BURTH|nr:GFA family protein [Burkholderia thailandensis]AHI68331.1 glutathione-dependent formaldehyde-activating enzyme family protein [Burkholderia thailandensis H0587]AIP65529.1 aldehyde-activating protein [Burkholderia thailandensis]AOI53980.1 aldehyde-activating protein [Burkholderia thailandensis]AOJ52964.1 aldehyde-activating protein [Burkholderia thailandensis]AVR28921.1 aldehyde-activating protein [Burkholderia thailandensis]
MSATRSLRCLCGAVGVKLTGEPAARAHCHCMACRDFYGAPMLSATAWPAGQVIVAEGDVASFAHPTRRLSRAFCATCGETVFGTNRLGMRVVPNAIVARAAGGELPDGLRPTMHLFYRHRIVDVRDDLPKYLDGWDGPTDDA